MAAKRSKKKASPKAKPKANAATKRKAPAKPNAKTKPKLDHLPRNKDGVVMLSGGNPQVAKADGNAPVQAYIRAMPGWKSALGKRLDALLVKSVPKLEKAVRWNSPMYAAGQGYFVSFHVLTKYVKLTFFEGKSLQPMPPGGTPKSGAARWLDIYEDDELDEAQLIDWFRQAAANPGWTP